MEDQGLSPLEVNLKVGWFICAFPRAAISGGIGCALHNFRGYSQTHLMFITSLKPHK